MLEKLGSVHLAVESGLERTSNTRVHFPNRLLPAAPLCFASLFICFLCVAHSSLSPAPGPLLLLFRGAGGGVHAAMETLLVEVLQANPIVIFRHEIEHNVSEVTNQVCSILYSSPNVLCPVYF